MCVCVCVRIDVCTRCESDEKLVSQNKRVGRD